MIRKVFLGLIFVAITANSLHASQNPRIGVAVLKRMEKGWKLAKECSKSKILPSHAAKVVLPAVQQKEQSYNHSYSWWNKTWPTRLVTVATVGSYLFFKDKEEVQKAKKEKSAIDKQNLCNMVLTVDELEKLFLQRQKEIITFLVKKISLSDSEKKLIETIGQDGSEKLKKVFIFLFKKNIDFENFDTCDYKFYADPIQGVFNGLDRNTQFFIIKNLLKKPKLSENQKHFINALEKSSEGVKEVLYSVAQQEIDFLNLKQEKYNYFSSSLLINSFNRYDQQKQLEIIHALLNKPVYAPLEKCFINNVYVGGDDQLKATMRSLFGEKTDLCKLDQHKGIFDVLIAYDIFNKFTLERQQSIIKTIQAKWYKSSYDYQLINYIRKNGTQEQKSLFSSWW